MPERETVMVRNNRFLLRTVVDWALVLLSFAMVFSIVLGAHAQTELLNVSYDPTRELYRAINEAFVNDWKARTGETLTIRQSHGGSGAQARAVIDGLNADVVTLALAGDIDAIAARSGKIPLDWQSRLPNQASPYTSTIVFLVRKGNPKAIRDWDDLVRDGIGIITPNPKTSGGARWNYLAAWAYAEKQAKNDAGNENDDSKLRGYIAKLLANVPVLDTGARGATTSVAQRGLGDVLLAWENEAYLVQQEFGADKFDIIVPSLSVLAEPPVALVEGNAEAKGTRKVAQAYLDFLYTPKAQLIIAQNFYRPYDKQAVAAQSKITFPEIELIDITHFGGWAKAQATHFADGGTFDQLYKPGK